MLPLGSEDLGGEGQGPPQHNQEVPEPTTTLRLDLQPAWARAAPPGMEPGLSQAAGVFQPPPRPRLGCQLRRGCGNSGRRDSHVASCGNSDALERPVPARGPTPVALLMRLP